MTITTRRSNHLSIYQLNIFSSTPLSIIRENHLITRNKYAYTLNIQIGYIKLKSDVISFSCKWNSLIDSLNLARARASLKYIEKARAQ